MHITRLELSQLRNLSSVSILPAPGLNILEGRNASGKTSLLEAIHMLCMARSFRSLRTSQVVQHGHASLTVFAQLQDSQLQHRLGLQRFTDNRLELRLDGQPLRSRAELVSLLPLQLLTPESTQLVTGSPRGRRQFLDWLMFHVEHGFHSDWMNYQRLLKQRNSLLRSRQLTTLKQWDLGLISYAEKIDTARKGLVAAIQPFMHGYFEKLLPGMEIALHYKQGWRRELSFENALAESLATDSRQFVTGVGPHRCDLVLSTDKRQVADVMSRGQLKLLVVAMHLAQMDYLRSTRNKSSIVLIDDLPAELDAQHRALLLRILDEHEHQVFITTTDRSQLDCCDCKEVKVFHVEHGQIKEVV